MNLAQHKGLTEEITDAFENDDWKTKLSKLKKIFKILLPILLQVFDSIVDAVYFIKLKTEPNIIQVRIFEIGIDD